MIRRHARFMRLEMRINEETGLRCFKGTFGNKTTIIGYFGVCPEMSDDGAFIESVRGYLSGEQNFPPSFTLMAGYLNLPLETASNMLAVLPASA